MQNQRPNFAMPDEGFAMDSRSTAVLSCRLSLCGLVVALLGLFAPSQVQAQPPMVNNQPSVWQKMNPTQWDWPDWSTPKMKTPSWKPPQLISPSVSQAPKRFWNSATRPVKNAWATTKDATKTAAKATVDFLTPDPPAPPIETVSDFLAQPRPQ